MKNLIQKFRDFRQYAYSKTNASQKMVIIALFTIPHFFWNDSTTAGILITSSFFFSMWFLGAFVGSKEIFKYFFGKKDK